MCLAIAQIFCWLFISWSKWKALFRRLTASAAKPIVSDLHNRMQWYINFRSVPAIYTLQIRIYHAEGCLMGNEQQGLVVVFELMHQRIQTRNKIKIRFTSRISI